MTSDTLLRQLISIKSVFPFEGDLIEFITLWLKVNTKCEVEIQEITKTRKNILVTKYSSTKSDKSVLLAGHLDTVPEVIGWETNPYEPTLKNGNLYGLGAWDMKAGLSIILNCLKKFEPQNYNLKAAFTVDEENYSIGAWSLVDTDFVKDVIFGLVPEPGFIHGDKGITIGRTGRSTATVKVFGKSAHGSFSQDGINSIDQANIFLNEIKKMKFSYDKDMGSTSVFPRKIISEANGFSVPDYTEIELDCKMVAPDTAKSIFEKVDNLGKKLYQEKKLYKKPIVKLKKRPTPFSSPFKLDSSSELIKLCQKVVKRQLGKQKTFFRESVADECIYVEKLGVPFVCIGPSGNYAHQANEYVELESVKRVEKIYLEILDSIYKK
jgi:acetylornithine deacetylase/succinyl-diaminopimelate desuccinylase-like protein